jgi:LuxR family transcriptional regulator, maltose regulon positive regulatory protein
MTGRGAADAALSLRGTGDPARAGRALEARGHAIAEYFIAEVLDRQPSEMARFTRAR